LNPYDVAAEVEMIRSAVKTSILLLEGENDLLLFEKFIDSENCYKFIANGKENAI
jgi:hypothetical protein